MASSLLIIRFSLLEASNKKETFFNEEDIDMASAAGSKGAFVGNDTDTERLKKIRHKYRMVLPLKSDRTSSSQKICEDEIQTATRIASSVMCTQTQQSK